MGLRLYDGLMPHHKAYARCFVLGWLAVVQQVVLCSSGWQDTLLPLKYWLITQEAMAPSRHDWKIVDWDVKPQHNQPTNQSSGWQCR